VIAPSESDRLVIQVDDSEGDVVRRTAVYIDVTIEKMR
jgi:hypothetical protein